MCTACLSLREPILVLHLRNEDILQNEDTDAGLGVELNQVKFRISAGLRYLVVMAKVRIKGQLMHYAEKYSQKYERTSVLVLILTSTCSLPILLLCMKVMYHMCVCRISGPMGV